MPSPPRNLPAADRGDDRVHVQAAHQRWAAWCVVLAGVAMVASGDWLRLVGTGRARR